METAGRLMQSHPDGLPGVAPMRLALTIAIIGFQSIQVSESYLRVISTPIWILGAILYPALFTISGFLLARSISRHSEPAFLIRRARRLLPALVVTILLAALVMGPLATTKSIRAYATDPEFGLYFLNIVAWPRFSLPAVFQFNNAGAVVNLPLWLSPFMLGLIMVATLVRRFGTRGLVIAVILTTVLAAALAIYIPDLAGFSGLQRKLLDGSGWSIVLAFLLGALAHQLRHRFPIHVNIVYLGVGVLVVAALAGNRTWLDMPAVHMLLAVPVAYIALFLAFELLPLAVPALRLERYLLGFLLLSFPIQQLWVAFGPRQQSFLLNFLLALSSTALLVVPLWHLLQRRLFLPDADDPRFGFASTQPLVRLSRRAIAARLPTVASFVIIALLLFAMALGVMALVLLAFQPESGGV